MVMAVPHRPRSKGHVEEDARIAASDLPPNHPQLTTPTILPMMDAASHLQTTINPAHPASPSTSLALHAAQTTYLLDRPMSAANKSSYGSSSRLRTWWAGDCGGLYCPPLPLRTTLHLAPLHCYPVLS